MTSEERLSFSRAKDQIERKTLEDIRTHGLHWVSVFDPNDADLGFSYSVGLWHTHNHPEVIIFGLDRKLSGQVLNGINRDIGKGKLFHAGLSSRDCLEGFACYFETFPQKHYRDHLGLTRWFYAGEDFPTVQMLWPTTTGIYPWESSASEFFRKKQPVFSNIPLRVS